MFLGDRIPVLREAKNLSQGDIEKRSGLAHPYLIWDRKRPHDSVARYPGEGRAGARCSPLPSVLRESGAAEIASSPEAKEGGRDRLGELPRRGALSEQIAESSRSNGSGEAATAVRCGSENSKALAGLFFEIPHYASKPPYCSHLRRYSQPHPIDANL